MFCAVSSKLDALGSKVDAGNARVLSEVRRQGELHGEAQGHRLDALGGKVDAGNARVLSEVKRYGEAQGQLLKEMQRMGVHSRDADQVSRQLKLYFPRARCPIYWRVLFAVGRARVAAARPSLRTCEWVSPGAQPPLLPVFCERVGEAL